MDSAGIWSGLGQAASVDWCEPNYVFSPYVAEWWNTLSSAPIAMLGIAGIVQARGAKIGMRFVLGFFAMTVVGFGSMAFHGTLLKAAQASDELPMILTGLVYAFVLSSRRGGPGEKLRVALLGGYGVIVTVAYFTLTTYFHFFLAAYALILTYLAIGTWRLVFREDRRPIMRRWFVASVCCYLGGFVVLWLPEHVLLACDHPLQATQLHAIFHLTSAVGSYSWLRLAVAHALC